MNRILSVLNLVRFSVVFLCFRENFSKIVLIPEISAPC